MHHYFYEPLENPGAYKPPAPPRKARKKKPMLWFALFVTLMSAMIILTIWISLGREVSLTSPRATMPISLPEEAPQLALEQAPIGDGTVMELMSLPQTEPLTFQEIYRKNIDAIVYIQAITTSGISKGTGIIMSQDGYVVTNAHVIAGSYVVTVKLEDGTEYSAKLVGRDTASDLAVLKLDAADLKPAEFGDSNLLQVGDVALAIGNPLGEELRGTMTSGIISAINRDVQINNRRMILIQTTAALNAGNSGGALLNQWGQVVGITTLKMSSWYESIEGLGFAIPTAVAKTVVDDLIAYGKALGRPTIGITIRQVGQGDVPADGEETPAGLWVESVDNRADAWAAGLRPGDVIVAVDGLRVTTSDEVNEIKNAHSAGDIIRLRIWREGEYLELDVMLMEQYELE